MQESKPKIPSKKYGFRYSKSLIFPYNAKQMRFFEDSQNPSNNNIKSLNKEKENSLNKKRLLMVQKINIKDQKNSFYKEGASEIFNDENLFFSNKYKDKKVVVGRNQSNLSNKAKFEVNFITKKNLGNFNKKRLLRSVSIKNKPTSSFRKRHNNALIDRNMMNVDYDNNSNYSIGSINSKYESFRKSFNMYGKRSSFFFGKKNIISDGELKIIYKSFLDLEKENKKKEIKSTKINDKNNINKTQKIKDTSNNKIYKNNLFAYKNNNSNSNIGKIIDSRLNLQEKILNKFQNRNKQSQNIIDKIIKNTTKNSNDILLMNQLDDYRVKMEKIDEEHKLKKENNYNKALFWLSSLRNYPKNNDEDKISNNYSSNNNNINNDTSFPIIYKNKRKMNQQKEDILDNYMNKFHYSFGSNSNLYCDIESNISPLYAFILSDTLKSNEKIRNSHINDYYNSKILPKENLKKLKKNSSVSYLKKNFNMNNSQEFIKNLNIEGKRLIDCEMEISKKLEGRKRLIKLNYNDDETDTKYLVKSYIYDKYHFPKVVNNAFELHSNQDI